MGVDTNVLLTENPSPLEILEWANEHYTKVNLTHSGDDFYYLNFMEGEDQRHIAIFSNGNCMCDYADVSSKPCALLSMGMWGNSEVIARRLATHFGGLIKVNDCTDDWTSA